MQEISNEPISTELIKIGSQSIFVYEFETEDGKETAQWKCPKCQKMNEGYLNAYDWAQCSEKCGLCILVNPFKLERFFNMQSDETTGESSIDE